MRLGRDPEHYRPALVEAIGDRIIVKRDPSNQFFVAEYGLGVPFLIDG